MLLQVLGSSSSGNCYLLRSERGGEVLAIEAGVNMQRVLKAIDYNVKSLVGCCITHEHGDHAAYAVDFAKYGVPLYMTHGTADAIRNTRAAIKAIGGVTKIKYGERKKVGGFTMMPIIVQHDAKEPCGYLIRHKECGTILFATDTYYLRYTFAGLNHIMIECNYSERILRSCRAQGLVSDSHARRIVLSHMSIDTCIDTLLANDLSKVQTITLLHLSDDHSNERDFIKRVESATGITTRAARSGMEITLKRPQE